MNFYVSGSVLFLFIDPNCVKVNSFLDISILNNRIFCWEHEKFTNYKRAWIKRTNQAAGSNGNRVDLIYYISIQLFSSSVIPLRAKRRNIVTRYSRQDFLLRLPISSRHSTLMLSSCDEIKLELSRYSFILILYRASVARELWLVAGGGCCTGMISDFSEADWLAWITRGDSFGIRLGITR